MSQTSGRGEEIERTIHIQQVDDMPMYCDNTLLPISYTPIKPTISGNLVFTDYDHIISKYDWDSTIMYRIMECESKSNPNAVNTRDRHRTCNGSYGLMQLSCEHLTDYGIWDSWNDPAENIRVAYDVWRRQGEGAWSNCYNSLTIK